jgi:AraC-like DNA-binding protein
VDSLHGSVIPLEDLWQREARWLQERLAESPNWESRFALIDHMLGKKISTLKRVARPEIRWAWSEIKRLNGNVAIAQMARSIGWSSRHFVSCFREQIGLTPKAASRRFRFDRARRLVDGLAPAWQKWLWCAATVTRAILRASSKSSLAVRPPRIALLDSRISLASRRTWLASIFSEQVIFIQDIGFRPPLRWFQEENPNEFSSFFY